MTQAQVKQRSGMPYHHSLDAYSVECLMEAQQVHRERGGNFSQGVIVRRALRLYNLYLKRLTDYEREQVETMRAAKGVM